MKNIIAAILIIVVTISSVLADNAQKAGKQSSLQTLSLEQIKTTIEAAEKKRKPIAVKIKVQSSGKTETYFGVVQRDGADTFLIRFNNKVNLFDTNSPDWQMMLNYQDVIGFGRMMPFSKVLQQIGGTTATIGLVAINPFGFLLFGQECGLKDGW